MASRVARVLGLLAALVTACGKPPLAPNPNGPPGPIAPAVPTALPDVWDSREELAGWVDNGLSYGPATLVGEGKDAMIHIGVKVGNVRLYSPAFNLGQDGTGIRTIRMRCRWIDGTNGQYGANGQYLSIDMALQLPEISLNQGPSLFFVVPISRGEWREEEFSHTFNDQPPFPALGGVFIIWGNTESSIAPKGEFDIDWIALVRQ